MLFTQAMTLGSTLVEIDGRVVDIQNADPEAWRRSERRLAELLAHYEACPEPAGTLRAERIEDTRWELAWVRKCLERMGPDPGQPFPRPAPLPREERPTVPGMPAVRPARSAP